MRLRSLFAIGVAASLAAACQKSDSAKVDELTKRVEKLEAAQKKLAEVESFVRPIMDQQKAQAQQQEAQEPDPDARFAVGIQGNAFDGPAGAPVTIIEAFDFA